MISGQLPSQHGVHTYSKSFNSLPVIETVFGQLEEYHKIGISANGYASAPYDFDRYFDDFYHIERRLPFPEGADPVKFVNNEFDISGRGSRLQVYIKYLNYCWSHDNPIQSIVNGIVGMINSSQLYKYFVDEGAKKGLNIAKQELRHSEDPALVFLNLMEGHIPYSPTWYLDSNIYDCPWGWSSADRDFWDLYNEDYSEDYWQRRNQLYRANIDYLDQMVANFLQEIDNKTTVIITSDHGDNLGTEVDNGYVNHRSGLTEGVLHVPFYIYNPPNEIEERTERYFSHLRIPELLESISRGQIYDLTEASIPAELVGMAAESVPDSSDARIDEEFWNRMIRCAYKDFTKVVWDSLGNISRYKLNPEKPNWQTKIETLDELPSWASAHFDESIGETRSRAVQSQEDIEIDEATRDRLKDFGYI